MLGEIVRARREELGLTISECARAAGISRAHLHRIEVNASLPSLPVMVALARALQLDISVLLQAADVGAITEPGVLDARQSKMMEQIHSNRFLSRLADIWSDLEPYDQERLLGAALELAHLRRHMRALDENSEDKGTEPPSVE
jgi:transcriptional regulator with XRE-family HTH domain